MPSSGLARSGLDEGSRLCVASGAKVMAWD